MKKLLSLFLALALVISTVATFSAEEEKAFDGYIYMTVERNTLGQGFIQEPIKVGYYEGDSLADITERILLFCNEGRSKKDIADDNQFNYPR